MTDEEKAKDYANEYVPLIAPIDDRIYQVTKEDIIKILKDCSIDSYIGGLKAGKDMNVPTKWHDLRKDPNDLPKVNQKVLLQIKDEDEPIMDFYRWDDMWNFANKYEVIAWCEIPKFSE